MYEKKAKMLVTIESPFSLWAVILFVYVKHSNSLMWDQQSTFNIL